MKGYWIRHFCIGVEEKDLQNVVENLVSKNQFGRIKRDEEWSRCLNLYLDHAKSVHRQPLSLEVQSVGDICDVDGYYWSNHNISK